MRRPAWRLKCPKIAIARSERQVVIEARLRDQRVGQARLEAAAHDQRVQ